MIDNKFESKRMQKMNQININNYIQHFEIDNF